MRFLLRYRGDLPAKKKCVEEKNNIRLKFSKQLALLWADVLPEHDPLKLPLAVMKDKRAEIPASVTERRFRVALKGITFVPFVTARLGLQSAVSIRLLQRSGKDLGDLDNRLKTLLDALRLPKDNTEVSEEAAILGALGGQPCFCLLEDDGLVTDLSVEQFNLYDPPDEATDERDVVLHVLVDLRNRPPEVSLR